MLKDVKNLKVGTLYTWTYNIFLYNRNHNYAAHVFEPLGGKIVTTDFNFSIFRFSKSTASDVP